MEFLKVKHGFSERRSLALAGMSHYEQVEDSYAEVILILRDLAARYPEYGHRRLHAELRKLEYELNHKTVARFCREEGLTPPRKKPKPFRKSGKRVRPSSSNVR